MLVTTKEMFQRSRERGYAIVAPDFWDSNSCKTYVETAEELGVPVITEEEFIVKFCDLTDFDDLYDKYSEGFWTYTVTKIR